MSIGLSFQNWPGLLQEPPSWSPSNFPLQFILHTQPEWSFKKACLIMLLPCCKPFSDMPLCSLGRNLQWDLPAPHAWPCLLTGVHSSSFQPHRPFFQFSESTLHLPTLGILWGIEGKGSFFLLEMFLPLSFNLLVPILILSLNVIPQRSAPSRSIWYFPLVTLIIICIIICFMPIPPTRLLSSLRAGTLCVLLSKAHWVLSTMPDTLQALNRSWLCKQKYEFILD